MFNNPPQLFSTFPTPQLPALFSFWSFQHKKRLDALFFLTLLNSATRADNLPSLNLIEFRCLQTNKKKAITDLPRSDISLLTENVYKKGNRVERCVRFPFLFFLFVSSFLDMSGVSASRCCM